MQLLSLFVIVSSIGLAIGLENLAVRTSPASGSDVLRVAYFDDGNDKQSVADLRNRYDAAPETLTEKERAILTAANRTGYIYSKKCQLGGNAFLINTEGRDAVVTNAHLFFKENGKLHDNTGCEIGEFTDLVYFPNLSYMDTRKGKSGPKSPVMETVPIPGESLTAFEKISAEGYTTENDVVILLLGSNISGDKTLDGRIRGAFKSSSIDRTVFDPTPGIMIGFEPRQDKLRGYRSSNYQECVLANEFAEEGKLNHSCDTDAGSSGSVLLVLEGREYKIVGLHTQGSSVTSKPLHNVSILWNVGTPLQFD